VQRSSRQASPVTNARLFHTISWITMLHDVESLLKNPEKL
jgi:hypothetical protein